MKIPDPMPPGREDLGRLRDVSRAGHYDRPARNGQGKASLGDLNTSPGNEDAATGRAKPNSTRAGRAIDYLDDRHRAAGTDPGGGVSGPGTPGHGRRMPQYKDDEKQAGATEQVGKLDGPV